MLMEKFFGGPLSEFYLAGPPTKQDDHHSGRIEGNSHEKLAIKLLNLKSTFVELSLDVPLPKFHLLYPA